MATGAPPWKGMKFESANALMYHIASCGTPPPLPPTLSVELKEFVLACFRQVGVAEKGARDAAAGCGCGEESLQKVDVVLGVWVCGCRRIKKVHVLLGVCGCV